MTITLVESPGDLPEGPPPIAVDEVDGELARRWKRADARKHLEVTAEQLEAAAAVVAERRSAVPFGVASDDADLDGLRRAAASAIAARTKAAGMRGQLERAGEAPVVDVAAERAVLDAEAWFNHVRGEREGTITRWSRALMGANVAGMAILAGRGATQLAEPAMPMVAVAPLGALALLTAGALAGRHRLRSARLGLDRALAAAGVHSVGGLAARRARLEAWQRRAAAGEAAERAAGRAHDRWARCVGADVPPEALEELVVAAAELHRAEESFRTARAAHDEALALADGPPVDSPLVVAGEPDSEQLDRLLQASGSCPVVLVAPDADACRRLADRLGADGQVARPDAVAAGAVAPAEVDEGDEAEAVAEAVAEPDDRAEDQPLPPPGEAVPPARPAELRDRVLETLKKALSLRSAAS